VHEFRVKMGVLVNQELLGHGVASVGELMVQEEIIGKNGGA